MVNERTIYKWTGLLFALTALVTALGHAHDLGMGAVWLAVSALFLILGLNRRGRS